MSDHSRRGAQTRLRRTALKKAGHYQHLHSQGTTPASSGSSSISHPSVGPDPRSSSGPELNTPQLVPPLKNASLSGVYRPTSRTEDPSSNILLRSVKLEKHRSRALTVAGARDPLGASTAHPSSRTRTVFSHKSTNPSSLLIPDPSQRNPYLQLEASREIIRLYEAKFPGARDNLHPSPYPESHYEYSVAKDFMRRNPVATERKHDGLADQVPVGSGPELMSGRSKTLAPGVFQLPGGVTDKRVPESQLPASPAPFGSSSFDSTSQPLPLPIAPTHPGKPLSRVEIPSDRDVNRGGLVQGLPAPAPVVSGLPVPAPVVSGSPAFPPGVGIADHLHETNNKTSGDSAIQRTLPPTRRVHTAGRGRGRGGRGRGQSRKHRAKGRTDLAQQNPSSVISTRTKATPGKLGPPPKEKAEAPRGRTYAQNVAISRLQSEILQDETVLFAMQPGTGREVFRTHVDSLYEELYLVRDGSHFSENDSSASSLGNTGDSDFDPSEDPSKDESLEYVDEGSSSIYSAMGREEVQFPDHRAIFPSETSAARGMGGASSSTFRPKRSVQPTTRLKSGSIVSFAGSYVTGVSASSSVSRPGTSFEDGDTQRVTMVVMVNLKTLEFIFRKVSVPNVDPNYTHRVLALTKMHGNNASEAELCNLWRSTDVLSIHEEPRLLFAYNRTRGGPSRHRLSQQIPVFGLLPSVFPTSWSPARRLLIRPSALWSLVQENKIKLDPLLHPISYWKPIFERIEEVVRHSYPLSSFQTSDLVARTPERAAASEVPVPVDAISSKPAPGRFSTPRHFENPLPTPTRTLFPGVAGTLSNPSAFAPGGLDSQNSAEKHLKEKVKTASYFNGWRRDLSKQNGLYLLPVFDTLNKVGDKLNSSPVEYCFRVWVVQLLRTFHNTLGSLEAALLTQYIWYGLATQIQVDLQVRPDTVDGLCDAIERRYPFARCTSVASPFTKAFLFKAVAAIEPFLGNVTAADGPLTAALGSLGSALQYHCQAVEDRVYVLKHEYSFETEIATLYKLVSLCMDWFLDDSWRENYQSTLRGELSGTAFITFARNFFHHKYTLACEAVIASGCLDVTSVKPKKVKFSKAPAPAVNVVGLSSFLDESSDHELPPEDQNADTHLAQRVFRLTRAAGSQYPSIPEGSGDEWNQTVLGSESAWTATEQYLTTERELDATPINTPEFDDLSLTCRRILKVMSILPPVRGAYRPVSEANQKLYNDFMTMDTRSPEAIVKMNRSLAELKRAPSSFCYNYLKYSYCGSQRCNFLHFCRHGVDHYKANDTLGPCIHVSPAVHKRAAEYQDWFHKSSQGGMRGSKPLVLLPDEDLPTKMDKSGAKLPPESVQQMVASVTAGVTEQLKPLAETFSRILSGLDITRKTDSVSVGLPPVLPSETPSPGKEPSSSPVSDQKFPSDDTPSIRLVSLGGDVQAADDAIRTPPVVSAHESLALLAQCPVSVVLAALEWVNNRDRLRKVADDAPSVYSLQDSSNTGGDTLDSLASIPMSRGAPMIFLQLYIYGMAVCAAHDGGSCVSFVNPRVIKWFESIGITFKKYKVTGGILKAYGGSDIHVLFAYVIPLTVGNKLVQVLFYLGSDSECSYDMLLGRNIHEAFSHSTDESRKLVSWVIDGQHVDTPILLFSKVKSIVDTPTPVGSLRNLDTVTIPAKTTVSVPVVSKVVATIPLRMLLSRRACDGPSRSALLGPNDDVRVYCRPMHVHPPPSN